MTTTKIPITTITFPEIALRVRDAHKLRGYFGRLFQEHSPLLHNHFDDTATDGQRYRYAYPLVQYKVLKKTPTLVGLGEGAELLVQLFLRIKEIKLDGILYPVQSKHIRHEQVSIGLSDDLNTYRYDTLWLGLNQKNHRAYQQANELEQATILKNTAVANILTFVEAFGLKFDKAIPEHRIMLKLRTTVPAITKFKNVEFMGFGGQFTTNVRLPNDIGLGKQAARGFGTISLMD
ncbi:CRISPR-associated endonuclease Cas6 [Dyadobacter tibetensis]|uniref:CRISPR-associated endonuclease Cas6 n=1 Tax=Dyadobacter tibetensis TaxID=1211851 RepID=UPI00046FDC10|nr:CRISPR-associated endonuclease Cas6 [Dyadobacter tibetensis]